MRKAFIAAAVAAVLAGCTAPSALAVFHKDAFYERSLSSSKKGEINRSLEMKAQVTATDLHAADPRKYPEDGLFCVGVYLPNDNDTKATWGLANPDVSIVMNGGIMPESVTYLPREDDLLKKLPYINNWAKYYLVKFPAAAQTAPRTITLTLKDVGAVTLDFSKVHAE